MHDCYNGDTASRRLGQRQHVCPFHLWPQHIQKYMLRNIEAISSARHPYRPPETQKKRPKDHQHALNTAARRRDGRRTDGAAESCAAGSLFRVGLHAHSRAAPRRHQGSATTTALPLPLPLHWRVTALPLPLHCRCHCTATATALHAAATATALAFD